jgi:hypothetical protein
MPLEEGLMLKLLCLFCVSLGVVGCAVAPASTSPEESVTDQALSSPAPEATPTFCDHITNCVQVCACDYRECVAGGGSKWQCGAEQKECLVDFCGK